MRHAPLPFLSLGLGLLAFFTLTGCERYPEDPIFAYGRVLQPDGTPHAGQSLTLERQHDGGYAPLDTTTTDARGELTFELLSGDSVQQVDYGQEKARLRVGLPLDEAGRGMFALLYIDDDVELPTLQPWDAHPRVESGPQGTTVAFPPAPAPLAKPETARFGDIVFDDGTAQPLLPSPPEPRVFLTTGDAPLWQQRVTTSPWTASPYVLEDFAAPRVQLRAASVGAWYFDPLGGEPGGVDFRVEWRTAHEPLPAGALRPLSRGATCESHFPGTCPWTDGLLESVDIETQVTAPQSLTLVFSLPRSGLPRHAVVRGLHYLQGYEGKEWLLLEGSEDGKQWRPLTRTLVREVEQSTDALRFMYSQYLSLTREDSPYGDLPLALGIETSVFVEAPLADGAPVRFVRLSVETLTFGGGTRLVGLSSLAELSVFE